MIGFPRLFIALLLFAGVTTVLAVSGLVGALQPQAGPGAFSGFTTAATTASETAITTATAIQTSTLTQTVTATSMTSAASGTVTQNVTSGVSSTTTTTISPTPLSAAQNNASYGAAIGQGVLNGLSSSVQPGTQLALVTAQRVSLFLAPAGWIMVVGAWIWRGRVRAAWRERGFESDVFELFMKMKGGATRIKLLNVLQAPKDRLQIAQQLGLDWKTVDRHVRILDKYGFIREQASYGTIVVYELTPLGKTLLKLYDELNEADRAQLVG